jgi:hypothetical protein
VRCIDCDRSDEKRDAEKQQQQRKNLSEPCHESTKGVERRLWKRTR